MNQNKEELSRKFNTRIGRLIVHTLLIMGIILAILIGSHNYYKAIVIKSQQQNILNVVTTVSAQLEEYFKSKDETLGEMIKEEEFLRQFQQVMEGEKLDVNLLNLLYRVSEEEFIALELINPEGKRIDYYADSDQHGFYRGEDIVEVVRTKGNGYFVETIGDGSINITRAVKRGGELLGFVRMKLNTSHIYRIYLANYQLNQKGYISLKDNQGRLFLHPSMENIGEEVLTVRKRHYPEFDWRELEENVKRQLSKETGVGIYHSVWPGDNTRVKKISGFTPVEIGNTFIISNFSVDYQETLSSFVGITNATIFISILLIITSLIIIYYIYKIEIKKNEIVLESIYMNELQEKNVLLMHQSKFAAMGELLATIAHQLKQPLNALKLSLYNINDYYELEENDKEYLEKLLQTNHRLVDKLAKTIDDFKYFFKPQQEGREFNIFEAIDFSIELNIARINDLEIMIKVEGDRSLTLIGESNVFSQVILNLLNNSIDALKDVEGRRRISISIQQEEEKVVVQLEDNGGGIKDEVLQRVFQPFVTTKGDQGTGLGLYIAKNILKEKFKGDLILENKDDGVIERIIIPKSS